MSKESEMFALMAEWESSGLDRTTFCGEHGIKVSKFSYWRTRYKKSIQMENQSDRFVPIKPALKPAIEVVYPNGVKIVLPASTDHLQIASFINLI